MNARADPPSQQRRFHHGDLRAALMEAAERTLRSRGAAQLSLRDVAREVGVSHAAPRRHFPERQDLLDALAENGYARLRERLGDAVAPHDADFSTRIRRATSAFAHFATENPPLLELMNAAKHQPEGSRVPLAAAKAFEPMADLIREGQQKRLLREGPFEDVAVVLYATINGLATLVNTGAIDAERLDELIDIALDQFLTGATTRG